MIKMNNDESVATPDTKKSPPGTSKAAQTDPNVTYGMVIYSDGGCRPKNPGPGGYGIHGYMYADVVPKKGAGKAGIMLTTQGYQLKDPEALVDPANKYRGQVTPIHYIDGFGALGSPVSNNYAELMATTRGLQEAAQYDVKQVQVFTDSEYVIKGLDKGAKAWARDNWKRPDGTDRPNAKTWQELVAIRDTLVERGVKVNVAYIEAHTEELKDLGNEIADTLATIGVMHNRFGKQEETLERSTPEGYWSYDCTRHPFLFHRRMYFNTLPSFNKPGEYYMGDHGKDDELLGKRISDGCYAVVRLVTPDPAIEKVRDIHIAMYDEIDSLAMLRVDNLFRADTHEQIMKYGHGAIEQVNMRRRDLYCMDREPLTREIDPVRIAVRAVESLSDLEEKLSWYQQADARIATTDLTAILYETVVKTAKNGDTTSSSKLMDKYNVGFAALVLEANYPSADGIKSASVSLTLGIDLLDRNALKRLETETPKVTLISWMDAPTIFRYATVIEANGSVGIFAGVYSNLRVVDPTK